MEPLKIGIVGLGTVGGGVVKLLEKNKNLICQRAGRDILITAVCAHSKDKDRGFDVNVYEWFDNPLDLVKHENVDVVLELVGGADGIAYDLIKEAISQKKPIITANKALLATHGYEIAEIADKANVPVFYEAAVAGGIPIVKTIREGLAGNGIKEIYGILNGTSNYILSEMTKTKRAFDDVLKDAQEKGYAEADPTFDIDGTDAAHKLAILSTIVFRTKPNLHNIYTKGISEIKAKDIDFAKTLGYEIKLIAKAFSSGDTLGQSVTPCLIPQSHPLSSINDVLNAVLFEGDFVKYSLSVGYGAGEGPTASAVVADVIDSALGIYRPVFGVNTAELKDAKRVAESENMCRFYMRLPVLDKPGVIAEVASILKDEDVSIESMLQHGHDPGQSVSVVMTTHETAAANIYNAIEKISTLRFMTSEPCLIQIEDLTS